ncbi:MAG: ribonuclease P protein component [Oscillospiraceae bacterium]|jgi:ribonuclease P protein component|nr:ribonuclease P protein component [Oscillospiraceae bacterium]
MVGNKKNEVLQLEYSQSLKKNHEFRRLYARGKSAVSPILVLYCRKNGRGVNRIGITVGGKVGNAVKRNWIRRRLRECYRVNEARFAVGYDLVLVARVRTGFAKYQQMEEHLLRLAGRLGLLKQEGV